MIHKVKIVAVGDSCVTVTVNETEENRLGVYDVIGERFEVVSAGDGVVRFFDPFYFQAVEYKVGDTFMFFNKAKKVESKQFSA